MTGAPPLQRLEAELHELSKLLNQGSDERVLLREVVTINNLIGMASRGGPDLRGEMIELQRWVNLITVGIKSSDGEKAREGLEGSLRAFDSAMRKRPQKNL